jgi:hypothetical protein
MSIRKAVDSLLLCAVTTLACAGASAGDIFRIIDHTGQPILNPPSGQASQFWVGCFLAQTGNVLTVQCTPSQLSDPLEHPLFSTVATGARGCPNEVYPFVEPGFLDPACFGRSYNLLASGAPASIGTPRCAPGQQPGLGEDYCLRPFRFIGAATAPGGLVASQWIVALGLDRFDGTKVPCVEPPGSTVCTAYPPADGLTYPHPYVTLVYAPPYACKGFQAPFDQALAMKKSNRAIPLKVQLFDSNNQLVTLDTVHGKGPILTVSYSPVTGTGIDVTTALAPTGQSSTGNQLNYDPSSTTWWFNLDSSAYTASGTYTVTLQTGDGTKYAMSPSCTGTFVR